MVHYTVRPIESAMASLVMIFTNFGDLWPDWRLYNGVSSVKIFTNMNRVKAKVVRLYRGNMTFVPEKNSGLDFNRALWYLCYVWYTV